MIRAPIVVAAALRAAFTLAVGLTAQAGHPAWLLLRDHHGTSAVLGNALVLVAGLLTWRRTGVARWLAVVAPWTAVAVALAVVQGGVPAAPGLRVLDALTQATLAVLLAAGGARPRLRGVLAGLALVGFLAWGFFLVVGLTGSTLGGVLGFSLLSWLAATAHR